MLIETVLEFVSELRRRYEQKQDDYSLGSAHAFAEVEAFVKDGTESPAESRAAEVRDLTSTYAYEIGYEAGWEDERDDPWREEEVYDEGHEVGYSKGYGEGYSDGSQT